MGRDLHVHTHPSRAEHWRHLIEIVALSIAALWGIYVFIYQERIKPATAAPQLSREISVQHTALAGGKEFVKVNVELKNIGVSRVQINAIIANLYGIKFLSKEGRQESIPLPGLEKTNFALETSEQKPLYSFFDTWHAYGFGKTASIVIEPGLSWSESFAVGIHQGEYDAANVVIEYCYSGETDRVVAARHVIQRDGTHWLEETTHVPGFSCNWQRNGLYYPL